MDRTTSEPLQALSLGGLRGWILAILILGSLASLVLWAWLSVGSSPEETLSEDTQEQVIVSQAAFEERTGVHITRVVLTAGGGMIDLRYQVLDPDKALIIHDAENPPAIIDEATGKIFDAPWMNHVHNGEYEAGVTYYTLLMNAGGVLSKGSKVTVILGGVRLEHLVVQ